MSDAVVAESLEKTWKGLLGPPHRALDGLSLRIPRGSAFGLIGPNGAGKTTFIKLLLGVARPTGGSVQVLGGEPDDARVRARIGYLPERLHLPAALKARDFLRSVATLKSLSPSAAELAALLERVGLEDTPQRIGTFSKGMRQRLGLAAALLGEPELLVLDEPTDGIDPVGRVEVRDLLLEERRRGATLLLNSHLLAETERVCDRVGILEKGRLKLEGALDEVRRASGRFFARFTPDTDVAVLAAAGFMREGNGWAFTSGDVDAVNAAVDQVRRAGGKLVELVPATRDLEAVLTSTLEGA
ncbi:MAG: ABC transporter ATP-binding protein [Myxococcota bacterium]|jgi:ABC-2 type transport system ATP-binding protein